jgi:hypothetical protein
MFKNKIAEIKRRLLERYGRVEEHRINHSINLIPHHQMIALNSHQLE